MSEIPKGETSEALSVPKRLVRSVSQKWKKKSQRTEEDDEEDMRGISFRCLNLYSRGGGCKVGADTSEDLSDFSSKRRSSSSEESKGYQKIRKFWKFNTKKVSHELTRNTDMNVFLPDDILELCLVRLPLTSLMTARLVCSKWRNLTTNTRFMEMRRNGSYPKPWVFLYGVVKDGYCSGEIHAYDTSLNQWHKIDSEILKGRFLFSVASIHEKVYIVGGRSSLTNLGKVDMSSSRTHKGVLVFNPLNKSWQKLPSMKHARSTPVLGIHEVNSNSLVFKSLTVRRHLRNSLDENEVKSFKFSREKSERSSRRFVLLVVGGVGAWDEPLNSGEIYDSLSNKWMEIQRLPIDFGIVCSGVVCNGMFYVYSEDDKLAGYDIERGFWVGIQTTPSPPRVHEYYPKLISCNKRLFVISVSWCEGDGEIGRRNKAIRKLWELDLMYLTWAEVSKHPDAPLDWNAVFVADGNLIFGVEMFKMFGQVLDFLTVCEVSDKGAKWRHMSSSHVARDLDVSSCMTKSMAVLHL